MANNQQNINDANKRTLPTKLDFYMSGFEYDLPKNLTVVLGLSDSYKNDIVQLIAENGIKLANNEKLKIAHDEPFNSDIKFPELIFDSKTNSMLYNYPEFITDQQYYQITSCNNSCEQVQQEIPAKYFLKKTIDYANSIKIIFTVSESQINCRNPKLPHHEKVICFNKFRSFLRTSLEMIGNIRKFKGSIALIVTKTDDYLNEENKIISDVDITRSIVDVLKHLRHGFENARGYDERGNRPPLSKIDQKTLDFVDIIVVKKNGMYPHIGIFKRPENIGGKISETAALEDNRKSLQMVINSNTKFTAHNKIDFSYLKIYLDSITCNNCLSTLVREGIVPGVSKNLRELRPEIIKYFESQAYQLNDIKKIQNKYDTGIALLSKLKREGIRRPEDCLTALNHLEDLHIPQRNALSISKYSEYFRFIEQMAGGKLSSEYFKWSKTFESIDEDLKSSQQWYTFLQNFKEYLSTYSIQEKRTKLMFDITQLKNLYEKWDDQEINTDVKLSYKNNKNDVPLKKYDHQKKNINMIVSKFLRKTNLGFSDQPSEIYKHLTKSSINRTKLVFLSKMLEELFFSQKKLNPKCEDHKLRIEGQFVKLSDISKVECSPKDLPVQKIELFASNIVYIDMDLDKTGDEVQFSIIAPTWEVVGERRITLDGKPGQAHKAETASATSVIPGSDGTNGIPGKPGGPAGSFLGIGLNFINSQNLIVSVKGGTGGPGQNGNDGRDGIDGTASSIPENVDEAYWPDNPIDMYHTANFRKYDCNYNKTHISKAEVGIIVIPSFEIFIFQCRTPQTCTNGGKGGKAGAGGEGGKTGGVKLIELGEKQKSHIKLDHGEGKVGIIGRNGNGAKGGIDRYNKFKIQVRRSNYKTKISKVNVNLDYTQLEYKEDTRCESGISDSGVNSKEREVLKTSNATISVNVINDYKSYVREILSEKIADNSLREFLYLIDNHKPIKDLYNAMGYINEINSLEKQFYKLHTDLPFLPFYESILNGITEYATEYNNNIKIFDDEKKALSCLYTATFSKIISLRNKKSNDLIVNMKNYLDSTITSVKKLSDYNKIAKMNVVQDKYHNSMNTNIKEIFTLIPEILHGSESIILDLDNQIYSWINETTSHYAKVEKHKKDSEEIEQKLQHALLVRSFLTIPKLVGEFLNLAGPAAKIIGTAISGTATVIEAFSTNDNQQIPSPIPLPEGIKNAPSIEAYLKSKQNKFKNQLRAVEQELNNSNLESEPTSMIKLKSEISKIKKEIENNRNEISLDDINKKADIVKDLLEKQKNTLEYKGFKNFTTMQSWSKRIDRAQTLVNLAQVPINVFKGIQDTKDKIEKIGDVIREADDQLTKLETYKDNIFKLIIPQYKDLQTLVSGIQHNLKDASHAALDVSKWKMQNTLKAIKHEIYKMTEGFKVQKEITHLMEKLNEVLSTVISVYDHIEDYRDKKELADYIKHINEIYYNNNKNETIQSPDLKNATDNLKVIIQSNIVLEEYEMAMNAFKQYIYPLADKYLAEHRNDQELFNDESHDIRSLVSQASNELMKLKTIVTNSKSVITKEDTYIHDNAYFNVTDRRRGPFYVWKYDEHKDIISQLLRGKEVILKADITKGTRMYAVKFREIGVNFKLTNETAKKELDQALGDFDLNMMHLGNAQYRCNDKFHTITHENVTLIYEMNTSEGNRVFTQLKENEAMLSPYTSWKLSLTSVVKEANFSLITQYENMTIDLALEGKGSYLSWNAKSVEELCTDSLSKYYKEDNTISGATTSELFNKEDLKVIPELRLHIEQKNHRRKQRNIDNREFEQEEESFTTSGACSSMKSSFINNIFNLVGTAGLVAYKYLDPVNKIKQWFPENDTNTDQENIITLDNNNVPTITKMSNIHSPVAELPKVSKMFIDEELPTTNNLLNDSLFCNHGNLLLLDLLIRSKSGVKYSHDSFALNSNNNLEYAQHLAYREYVK